MELNATLFGQMITFALFIWFTMRFVWPPLVKAMETRKNKIADGLAAAERGKRELELAQHKAADMMRDAKIQAADIVEQANQRANRIVEDAKAQARVEGEKLIKLSKDEIAQERLKAKQELKNQVAIIAIAGAEKILGQQVDKTSNKALVEKMIEDF
ncbi:MAG: F0F1 ATP synthase subunit B [Pseudomonadota bacterium]